MPCIFKVGTEKEKNSLDSVWATPINAVRMDIERKATGEVIEIDLEGMENEMKRRMNQQTK